MEPSPVSSTTTLPSSGPQSVESLGAPRSTLDQAVDLLMDALAKHKYSEGKVNVVEALQEFWEQKRPAAPAEPTSGPGVSYESEPADRAPFSCFVTLPCGACFASAHPAPSKAEARRGAARVALLNSVLDEHAGRRISDRLIDAAVTGLSHERAPGKGPGCSAEAAALLRRAMAAHKGEGLLPWEAGLCTLRLLHWNGSLRAMRDRGATRDQVLERYAGRAVDDNTRSQMALDWMAREQASPGVLAVELRRAVSDLRHRQARGRELRFEKERHDILLLAHRQLAADAASAAVSLTPAPVRVLPEAERPPEQRMESRA